MFRLICSVLLLGSSLLIAAKNPDETWEMKNGRFWNDLPSDDSTRSIFLVGMLDGWHLRGFTEATIKGKVILAFNSGGDFTTNDLADMVSSVYAETENIALPIGWVAMGCLAVQRGETTRAAVFLALRKYLGDVSNKKGLRHSREVSILCSPRVTQPPGTF